MKWCPNFSEFSSWSADPHPIPQNSQLNVAGCVYNNGRGAAGASRIALYLSLNGDTNLGNGVYTSNRSVSALSSGYSRNI
jgi:hypothetical protein